MAKNEAKIKFTAETGEFNESIKKSNDEMQSLRAELKLNESQMKNTGSSVTLLEKKHSLLESQLNASNSKTEALTQKVAKAVEIYGENSAEVMKLKTQLTNAKRAEEDIKNAISKCNKEIEDQVKAQKQGQTATQKLTDKIDNQKGKLDKLKGEYVEAILKYGETSREAQTLARKIEDLSDKLNQSKNAFSDASKKADKLDKSLDDVGDSAKNTEEGFTVMKGVVADLASNAIQAAIGKVSEFIGYLMELPEATREIRQDMATLETSFERAGFTTEQATQTWKDLYKVFGEDDRAVETANHIAKMSTNQEELSQWVTITKGIWGSYQDSLPVEGLAEASAETAKTGKVTGGLADALNWSSEASKMFAKYMSEDVTTAEDAFNEALKECTTEQERQSLITETLTKLYGGAATEYDKASGAQLEAKDATAENILVQNELADTMEPLTTAWQGMKNELLVGVMPAVKAFSEWGVNALGWLREHPVLLKTLGITLGVVAAALGALILVVSAYTIAQWAMNAAILANPITWIIVGVVAAIAALIAIIVVVIKNWDKIREAGVKAWNGIVKAWKGAGEWFKGIWKKIQNAFSNVGGWFKNQFTNAKNGVINAWANIRAWASKTWGNIKSAFSNVGGWFKDKFLSAKNGAINAWSNIKSKFTSIKNGIVTAFSNIKAKLCAPFEKARDTIKGIADKIKGFFKGNISMPKIKLPHFSISPKGWKIGDLLKGVKPKLGIEWYAKAMDNPTILNRATIFGSAGNRLLGGGEAGSEMIGGTNTIMRMIQSAVDKAVNGSNKEMALWNAIEDLANRPIELNINGRQFALATASDSDNVNGVRSTFKTRGLIID